MCTQNIYTYIYADGYREAKYGDVIACEKALRGSPCPTPSVFEYPAQHVAYSAPYAQLPPTPQYSPLPSTPVYRSGDDSDRSFASTSSKKKNRSSGIYINGQKVLDLNRRTHRNTPHTPPQNWSVPASPNSNTYSSDSSSHRRPVILNDGNRLEIEVVSNDRPSRSHSRHTSSSSHHSEDSEKRRRRHEREKHQHEEEERRKVHFTSRIAKANREISERPSVPMAPALKRASTYKRPNVEVTYDPEAELRKEARREERARRKEEEDLKKRLKDRMSRGSVSPRGRRHSVMYDDGPYRWEYE